MKTKKIALGTAQWGMNYGISNSNGVPLDKELNSILSLARQCGINVFDTASKYGNAEERLGKLLTIENKIVTKIGGFENGENVMIQLQSSLKKLKKNIYACLFHSSDELIQYPDLWLQLILAKKKGLIKKIGYSLYEPKELEYLLEMGMRPDIIQVPYNLLDRKFESYIKRLKSEGVEIHIRSVFLQGLFFKSPLEIPPQLYDLKPALIEIDNLSKKYNLSKLELSLGFVLQNPNIDHVVVGVETKNQLEEIINAVKIKIDVIDLILEIPVNDNKLLNPSNWKN